MRHASPISGVACWQSEYVATAGYDNQVILWDAQSQQPLARASHDHLVNQCKIGPKGDVLATASSDYTARLWELPNLRLKVVYAGHDDDVEAIDFRADGKQVATACRDGKVRIFDVDGRLIHTLSGHTADVSSVQWIGDGRYIVSSGDDGTIRIWNAAEGRLERTVNLGEVETDTVVARPDGVLYAGNDEGNIITIAVDGTCTLTRAHDAGVKRVLFDAASACLISMSYDRRIRIWSTVSAQLALVSETSAPAEVWMRSAAPLSDGRIAFGTFGTSYAIFDRRSQSWKLENVQATHGVNAVTVDGDEIWTVGDAGVVRLNGGEVTRLSSLCNFLLPWDDVLVAGGQSGELFDARTGKVFYQHRSPINCGARIIDKDGTRVVVGTYTGEGLIFDRDEHGAPRLRRQVALHSNAVKGLACDGVTIFSVCANRAVAFHDCNGELVDRIKDAHEKIANGAVAVGPGFFASVSRDLTLRLWKGGATTRVPTPHDHSIKCASVCPVTQVIATAAYDGRVALYDTATKRWWPSTRPTCHGISSLVWSGAPGKFLASSYDGAVYKVGADGDDCRLVPPVIADDLERSQAEEARTKISAERVGAVKSAASGDSHARHLLRN